MEFFFKEKLASYFFREFSISYEFNSFLLQLFLPFNHLILIIIKELLFRFFELKIFFSLLLLFFLSLLFRFKFGRIIGNFVEI